MSSPADVLLIAARPSGRKRKSRRNTGGKRRRALQRKRAKETVPTDGSGSVRKRERAERASRLQQLREKRQAAELLQQDKARQLQEERDRCKARQAELEAQALEQNLRCGILDQTVAATRKLKQEFHKKHGALKQNKAGLEKENQDLKRKLRLLGKVFLCGVCGFPALNPAVFSCGHTHCSGCILEKDGFKAVVFNCPAADCQKKMTSLPLPCQMLKDAIFQLSKFSPQSGGTRPAQDTLNHEGYLARYRAHVFVAEFKIPRKPQDASATSSKGSPKY